MDKFTVLHIYEEAYGCEERPEGYVPGVEVILSDTDGRQRKMRQEDPWLYSQNIGEGDTVFIGNDGKLYKS